MKLNKKIILPVLGLATAATVGFSTVTQAQAQGPENGQQGLMQRIAQHFNLNQDEVEQVFAEDRQERQKQRQQEMQQRFEENLSTAVSEGRLTEEQKQAVLAKHQEIQAKMEELKDLDPEERREQVQAVHQEMQDWAEGQGIDLEDCGGMMGPMEGAERGRKGGKGGMGWDVEN